MTMTRSPGKPQPPSRKIMHQSPPPSGPKARPMSPGVSKQADQLKQEQKKSSGRINPKQQRY
jgi:hypothetical protein